MKICQMCNVNPVAAANGKYCAECREKARVMYQEKAKQKRKEERASFAETRDKAHPPGWRTPKAATKAVENRPNCPGCVYCQKLYGSTYACHYTVETGQLRQMPASECYKHKGTPYKPEGGQRKASNETVNKS